jgi:predicted ATPase
VETFGEWLRQQRELRNLTRKEFAGRVGCSIALLRKIADGERRPSIQIAELIANNLDISSAERSTFVKVARGELSVGRLSPVPSSTTLAPPQKKLPVLPMPFIGRRQEVEDLSQFLRDPQCRLLTLVGPGGIGKTRLAIAAAEHVQDDFDDGVYFAAFTPVNSTRFIVPVIADAVGFAFEKATRSDPKTQLFNYLKGRRALLLTDNLEQLLAEPGIEVLAELLAAAPLVKLLATSRESLGLQEEWVFEVQGLPVPNGANVGDSPADTSVELFLQRARRAHVGFYATPADYSAIIRICQLVDGMPLGIELAAAWVRTLSCEEIAREIERGLDFLSGSARDLPARHRSMRAVFDHSWRLLAEEEQGVLRRLSVFQDGFGREAAEIVAGATLSLLSSLVTKSFIRRSGAGRYDLHELVCQFAAEQLAGYPEEQAVAQERHARHSMDVFRQADGRLRSAAQREALAELTAEMDNFRAAWDWAVAHGAVSLFEPALRTFTIFFDIRGWYREGLDLLDRAIAELEATSQLTTPGRIEQVTLGHLLVSQGLFALRIAQHEQAIAALERSLAILRPLHEPRVLMEAVTFLGLVLALTGKYSRAFELYVEGEKIATAIGDRWFAALCRISQIDMGGFMQGSIEPEKAYEQFRSVVADLHAIGDPRFTAIGLNGLSLSALRIGRYDEARHALEDSVAQGQLIGDRWNLGFAYRGLGIIAQSQGEHNQAVAMFRTGLDILTDLGARQDVARVLAEMSRSVFGLGNDAEAGRLWREALRIAVETSGTFIALEALVGLARLQAKQGERVRAITFLSFVLQHPATLQDTRDRANDLRRELEAPLSSQQREAVLAQAEQKTFMAVVNEILNDPGTV